MLENEVYRKALHALETKQCNNVHQLVRNMHDQIVVLEHEMDQYRIAPKKCEFLHRFCNLVKNRAAEIREILNVELKEKEKSAREVLDSVSKQVSTAKETLKNAKLLQSPHLADMETYLVDMRKSRDSSLNQLNQIVLIRNVREEQMDKLCKICEIATEETKNCLEDKQKYARIFKLLESDVMASAFENEIRSQVFDDLARCVEENRQEMELYNKFKKYEEFIDKFKNLHAALICMFWRRSY
jgi:hypothetical protein